MKKVLVIGSGGREHALGWKIAQDDEVSEVIYAPGNGGTQEGKGRNVALDAAKKANFPALWDLIQAENIDMAVVGPEQPLVDGIVDFLNAKGYNRVFGPTSAAAKLEADKFYSNDLMSSLRMAQAESMQCYSTDEAVESIRAMNCSKGIVIKARGLTGGKGVSVCDTKEQALEEITKHSAAFGPEVLVAERLYGQEFSIFGISDGNRVYPIEISVQDHKPLRDDDKGPNTGGMGAYGPAPVASAELVRLLSNIVMTPIVQKMKADGNEYKGFMYAGMIMTEECPNVLEFNVRFGDPECQPAMMMLQGGLYKPLSLALEGKLDQIKLEFNKGAACCVVMASQGYPGSYNKGLEILGIDDAIQVPGVAVFHAGTAVNDGKLVTSGGRVLGVTAYASGGISVAQTNAYRAATKIHARDPKTGDNVLGAFHYRTDIASKAFKS